jgi:adenine phosphoribosyltransferase
VAKESLYRVTDSVDAIRKRRASRALLCKRLSEYESLAAFVSNVSEAYAAQKITKVAAPEAMAFALAGAIAERLRCGLILITKSEVDDKNQYHAQSFVDYSQTLKTLYLLKTSVNKDDLVLVVDDYIETGAQVRATCQLLRAAEATIVAIACHGKSTDAQLNGLPTVSTFNFTRKL